MEVDNVKQFGRANMELNYFIILCSFEGNCFPVDDAVKCFSLND